MSILYLEEHSSCSNYISDFCSSFKHYILNKGRFLYSKEKGYHCILFMLHGKISVSIDSQRYILEKNTSIFIPLHSAYQISTLLDSTFIISYFDKPIDLCEKTALESLKFTEPEPCNTSPVLKLKEPFELFLSSLELYLKEGASCKHFHAIKQKEMFFIFRYFYTRNEVYSFFKTIISRDLDFKSTVLQNYSNVTSVKELAEKCNYSLSSFNRCFKDNFNESPSIWLQTQKIKHIKIKLNNKNISFSQIINEFNFSSPSHFTVFCRKHLHLTPSEYRKSLR
ncbi:AraC-like DNA-binding protein [Dysgonomonas alginatilytica]|uniref:AraC-like DNA-binding protein n=1 Tax=Dysgonomonas alginatilytica TaxID=1605892 RepID=A0A2V3PU14_9BACT|nr:AraC family transcriptional regulator [Dysgonomonas alginatilytica]PXV67390.1 AraC-like DNA-binding protein [Dysgonomonas alginatilytica]